MKRRAILATLLAAWPLMASAQQFGVGQHVLIGSTGETGTVLQIGQTTPEGGVMLKILLDKPSGPTQADREVWYNSRSSRVSLATTEQPGQMPPAKPSAGKVELHAGQRVHIGSLGVDGTVVQVLGVLGNGAQMLTIEIDKNAPKYPGVSNMFDTISSQITPLN